MLQSTVRLSLAVAGQLPSNKYVFYWGIEGSRNFDRGFVVLFSKIQK